MSAMTLSPPRRVASRSGRLRRALSRYAAALAVVDRRWTAATEDVLMNRSMELHEALDATLRARRRRREGGAA